MSWLPVEVTVEPTSEPLTLAEVKAQCRVDGTTDDGLLTAYIVAARRYVEEYTGLKLMEQTVVMRRRDLCDVMALPAAPISEIVSVQYLDMSNATQTLSPSVYRTSLYGLRPQIEKIWLKIWPVLYPSAEAVTITATAGFDTIPDPILHAMKLLISGWYDERSALSGVSRPASAGGEIPELPHAVTALLSNYRLSIV